MGSGGQWWSVVSTAQARAPTECLAWRPRRDTGRATRSKTKKKRETRDKKNGGNGKKQAMSLGKGPFFPVFSILRGEKVKKRKKGKERETSMGRVVARTGLSVNKRQSAGRCAEGTSEQHRTRYLGRQIGRGGTCL